MKNINANFQTLLVLSMNTKVRSCMMYTYGWGSHRFFSQSQLCRYMFCCCYNKLLNSSPPSAAYMRKWTGSLLVQVMAWRQIGAKPLPEPVLAYCQLDSKEQISVKLELKFYHFHSRKCIWKYGLSKWQAFCPGGDELTVQLPKIYDTMVLI